MAVFLSKNYFHLLGLVYTSGGLGVEVGVGSVRSVITQWKSKLRVVNGLGSSMESESEGSERFGFLPIPLLLASLTIQCKIDDRNWKLKLEGSVNQNSYSGTVRLVFTVVSLDEKLAEVKTRNKNQEQLRLQHI